MKNKLMLLRLTTIGLAVFMLAGCQQGQKRVKGDIPLKKIPAGTFVDIPAEYKPVFQTIYFDFDKSDIRKDMADSLNNISEWMKDHPKVLLRCEGHCDERGTEEYNMALGERRALSVRAYIAKKGVSPDRIFTVSYGEERPANPGHDEISWAENRRVEFKLSQ